MLNVLNVDAEPFKKYISVYKDRITLLIKARFVLCCAIYVAAFIVESDN